MKKLVMFLAVVIVACAALSRTFKVEATLSPMAATVSTNTVSLSDDIEWGRLEAVHLIAPASSTGMVAISTTMVDTQNTVASLYFTNATASAAQQTFRPTQTNAYDSENSVERCIVFGDLMVILTKTGTSTNSWDAVFLYQGD